VWASSLNRFGVDDRVAFRHTVALSSTLERGQWTHQARFNWRNGYADQPQSETDCAVTTLDGLTCVAVQRRVSAHWTIDWTSTWRPTPIAEVSLGLVNVFNRRPPPAADAVHGWRAHAGLRPALRQCRRAHLASRGELAVLTPCFRGAIVPADSPQPLGAFLLDASNPYGLAALWSGSDLVAKTVLLILVVMSVGSWYLLIVKWIEQQRMLTQAKATEAFWTAASVAQGVDTLAAGSPFRFIAQAGADASVKHAGLLGQIDLNTWITMSIQRAIERVQGRLQNGLAFLATVGSTAPFVGLFGTVWGIYHALTAIGVAGQASIDKVAGPVGESLIMTAIGLAVAVPAVLGYNWLVRRNKAVMDEVRGFAADLHAVLLAQASAASKG
jgi:biopolymer transport protein ExbB